MHNIKSAISQHSTNEQQQTSQPNYSFQVLYK